MWAFCWTRNRTVYRIFAVLPKATLTRLTLLGLSLASEAAAMARDLPTAPPAGQSAAATVRQLTPEVVSVGPGVDERYRALFVAWRAAEAAQSTPASIPVGLPVENANMTSGFGVRSDPFRARAAMHPGVDLAAPLGTPIYATADGVVDRSEWNEGGYGNLVEIDHGQGIQTRYGHLSRRLVEPGAVVHRGQLIGLMGSTGRSTGSHLHYEVRISGQAVNPVGFMPLRTDMIAMNRATTPVAEGGPVGGSR